MPIRLENRIDTGLISDNVLLFRFTMKTALNFIQFCLMAAVLVISPAVMEAQFVFTTYNDTITITGYTGNPTVLNIPSTTNGYPITGIADELGDVRQDVSVTTK